MRIKLVAAGELPEGAKSAYLAYCREQVTAWIASLDHGELSEWPAVLETLATIAADVPGGGKFPPHVRDSIEAMSPEAVATLAALAGNMAANLGITAEQMVALHHEGGDAVTGTAIAGFMLGRPITGAEQHVLAHLLGTLHTEQRVSLVCMAVAFLCVFGFTPDDIRNFDYPGDAMTPGMPDPCQPIGCDNGIHVEGCPYAAIDSQD